MSQAYGAGAMRMDGCLGMLAALAEDAHTLLIGLADHGGGGIVSNDHESDHPLDRTIPLFLHGMRVARGELIDARLIDVPATVAAALGVEIPRSYEGRVLSEAFAPAPEAAPATAVA
jgi:arylsulfatase A-like enzyme